MLFVFGCLLSSCAGLGSTSPVVKIGLVAPFEGLRRHLGYDVLYAVKLAVRERNAAGGVGGHMVELVALDDSNDPAQSAVQARKMIVDTDVMGVIGHFSQQTALAVLHEYHGAGLALITPVAADAVPERSYDEVFRLSARNDLLGADAARYVVEELGMHRLAVLRGRDDLADAFVRAVEGLGAEVVLDADAGSQTWLVDFKAGSPELVFYSGEAVEGAELIMQAREAGLGATFMGGNWLDGSQLGQIGGEAARGTLCITTSCQVNNGEDFVAGYQALAGDLPGPQAVVAYDATRVLLEALTRAIKEQGRPSRAAVVVELHTLRDYPGLIGPIAFDDNGDLLDPKTCVYRVAF